MNEPNLPNPGLGGAAANDPFQPANDPFQAAKASALKAAEELRAAATQKAAELRDAAENRAQQLKSAAEQKAAALKTELTDKATDIRHYADDALEQARDTCMSFVDEAEKLAREKPRKALMTAFGIGLVVGLILRR